jgi:hypothetical protein
MQSSHIYLESRIFPWGGGGWRLGIEGLNFLTKYSGCYIAKPGVLLESESPVRGCIFEMQAPGLRHTFFLALGPC